MKRERRRVERKNLLVEEKIEKKDLGENVVDGEQRPPEDAAITGDAENTRTRRRTRETLRQQQSIVDGRRSDELERE